MEVKTCEEYVLSKLTETEKKVEMLENTINHLNKVISEYEATITTYDELFREHGTKDIFDSSVHVCVDVSESYTKEKEYYDFLISRNEQFLKVSDYRKSKDCDSQEDDE